MTEGASKPSCRLSAFVGRKLGKIRAGLHKKVDNLRSSFGHTHEHPDSYNDVGSFPVPTSPIRNNFCNAPGPFPESAPPPGWRRPQNFDFHEASGSNHPSNQNSECFDGDAVNREEYRRQHVIANYGDLHRRQDQLACPSLADQLAASLQDVLLETPTSHDHNLPVFDPWKEFINDPEEILWPDARDQHQTENNTTFQFGSMVNQHQIENNTTSPPFQFGSMMNQHQTENNSTWTPFQYASMMDQYQTANNTTTTTVQNGSMMSGVKHQTENNLMSLPFQYGSKMDQYQTGNNTTSTTVQYGSMVDQYQTENNTNSTTVQYGSMMTGDTGESMMDTGASNCGNKYILNPVPEEAPHNKRRYFYYDYYCDFNKILRGEPRGSSGRRGRGFRIMGRILCITVRFKAGRKVFRSMLKRPYSALGQNRPRRIECTSKKIRTDGSPTSSVGDLLQFNRSRQQCTVTKKIHIYRNSEVNKVSEPVPTEQRAIGATKRIQTGASSPSSVGDLLQEQKRSRQQTRRACGSSASGSSAGRKSALYTRIAQRSGGKWVSEIRLSKTGKAKVWLGTYETEVHAALAADAGVHHCLEKPKKFNFPDLVTELGPSQYQAVHALWLDGRKDEATAKVTNLARTHATTFAPSILGTC